MRDNIIKVSFGTYTTVRSRAAWRNDWGMRLQFVGLELPTAYEVHFSNSKTSPAKTAIGDETGVDIPDEFFASGADQIYAWLFLHNGEDSGYTVYEVEIPLRLRPEVSNEEPTPVQQDAITQAIAVLQEESGKAEAAAAEAKTYAERAKEAADSIDETMVEQAVEDYLDDHPVTVTETDPTVPSWAKQPTKPTYTAEEVGALSEDDLQGAVDTALAQAKASGDFDGADGAAGPQGPKGDKGDPGDPGVKGDKGDTGAQGPKGDKGDTGAQGPKGDKGDTGAQGPKGDKGDPGAKGDKGDPGEPGKDAGSVIDLGDIDPDEYDWDMEAFIDTVTETGTYVFGWDEFKYWLQVTRLETDVYTFVDQSYWGTEEGASSRYYRGLMLDGDDIVSSTHSEYITTQAANEIFAALGHNHVRVDSKAQSVWDYCNQLAPNNTMPVVIYNDTLSSTTWLIEVYIGTRTPVYALQRVTAMNNAAAIYQRFSNYYSGQHHWGSWYTFNAGDIPTKVTEVTVSTAGAVTQALDAGKIYHFTGALTSLTITLNAPAAGDLAQYHFDFVSGSTATTLSLPNGVMMPEDFSVEANTRYEVDILNRYALAGSWEVSQ